MPDAVQHLSALEIVAYVFSYIGGMLLNYAVKTKRSNMDWKQYWTSNPISSIAAVFVTTGMCITLLISGESNHLTYLGIAFTVENLINTQTTKAESSE